jgi:hypothetical protein
MKRNIFVHLALSCCLIAAAMSAGRAAHASVEVNYVGSSGLQANAIFDLVDATHLSIVLTNTSVSPFGGGGSDMVLSSINFEVGVADIIGGTVMLNGTSAVVTRSGAAWVPSGFAGDLDDEYGFSNGGVGNASGSGAILVGVTAAEIDALLDSAVTSHSGGGSSVTTFNGASGVPGGLDFGLVATGSAGFGGSEFIRDSIKILLTLSASVTDLDFLEDGTYVEFGSDFSYVGGTIVPPPVTLDPVPEATTVAMWLGLAGVFGGVGLRKRLRRA